MMGVSRRELLILGGLVVVAAVLYFFLLLPIAGERARLTAEAERLTRQSEAIQSALRALSSGKPGLEKAQLRLEEIRARLLPPGGLSPLFAEISRPTQPLGVRIISYIPKGPDPARHGQVTCDLILEGTYLQLGRYLEALFRGRFLLAVDHLHLRSAALGNSRLRMDLTVKTWMQESSG